MFTATVSDLRFPGGKRLKRLNAELRQRLQQGMQPQQIALTLALGATIGLLPTLWGTSLICLLLAWLLGLNHVLMQVANYLVYPLQILLFLPYFRFGQQLFACSSLPENLDHLCASLRSNPGMLLEQYWRANLHAVCAWLMTVPLLLSCCYPLARLILRRMHSSARTR